MTTFLQNAIGILRQTVQSAAGVTVNYVRLSNSSETELTAVPGSTQTEADNGDGVIRTDRMHDFIVDVADLGFVPSAGDRIEWDSRTYEVMNPTGGKHYDEVGPYQQMYRIHTKQVYGS